MLRIIVLLEEDEGHVRYRAHWRQAVSRCRRRQIVVEKIAGNAGDSVTLDDILLAGEGGDLKATKGLTVGAEIIAQAKAEKVIVFKKRRRHNYRRRNGHRQQHTILKITSIGGAAKKAAKSADAAAPAADA